MNSRLFRSGANFGPKTVEAALQVLLKYAFYDFVQFIEQGWGCILLPGLLVESERQISQPQVTFVVGVKYGQP
ncbi:MAG: hypothetical protein ACE5NP_06305 [Anaerolineae bacterium]